LVGRVDESATGSASFFGPFLPARPVKSEGRRRRREPESVGHGDG
jgi:hypothetical protein